MRRHDTILVLFVLLLGACSPPGDGAQLVAAFPRGGYDSAAGEACAQTGFPGDSCHAYLAISTSDPARLAGQAEDLAERYDGYRVDVQQWRDPAGTGYTLVLAVPSGNFDALVRSLRRLGRLERQTVWSEWSDAYPGDWSRIVLDLQPRPRLSLPLPEIHWNPLETLMSALRVSFTILSVLVDLLIWVLVVAGPFVLIGLGLRFLARRLRPR